MENGVPIIVATLQMKNRVTWTFSKTIYFANQLLWQPGNIFIYITNK